MTVNYAIYIRKNIQELFKPGAQPATCAMGGVPSFPGVNRSRRGVAINLHLVSRLKKSRAIPLIPLWVFFYGLLRGELYL